MEPGSSRPELIYKTLPPTVRLSAEERRTVKNFGHDLLEVTKGSRFTCLFADDVRLRKLNREFLGHDSVTDVLSFPSGTEDPLGDIAISVERVRAQALTFGHTALDEVRVLMLHGVLHLVGFDHERDGGQMAREERKWRTHFGLPQTLIARSRVGPGGSRAAAMGLREAQ